MKLKSKKTSKHITERYTVDKSNLIVIKNYVDGKLVSVGLEGKGPHGSMPVLVRPSFNEFIKKSNPFHDYKNAAEHYYDWKSPKDMENVDFDKAVRDGLIYYFYGSGHVLFDHKGKPVPLPHSFDYIGTDFHSKAIDIEKAKEVLSKHPWVINKDSLEITDVPSYNSDGYNHRYLGITLFPDAKNFEKMYKMSLKTHDGDKFFSVRLKELVIGKCYAFPKWDPLKIHKFRKKKEDE